jgi:S1-C subfamily serine protease
LFGGDGYGPSDHSVFYAAGVPVLHFFTGVHADYHRPTDDAARINGAGGAQAAELAADLVAGLARREERLTYRRADPPPPAGDVRSHGASLGVLPDYAGAPGGRPGVLLAGVRAEGPAARAGLRRGDLLVELAGQPVRDAHDLAYLLRKARPGERATAVVEREGKRLELPVTFGARSSPPH